MPSAQRCDVSGVSQSAGTKVRSFARNGRRWSRQAVPVRRKFGSWWTRPALRRCSA